MGNNPLRFIDPTGRTFDEASEAKAKDIEQGVDRRAAVVAMAIVTGRENGEDVGGLEQQLGELQQTKKDIQDMRSSDTEFRLRLASDESNPTKVNGVGVPVTTKTGENQITMYVPSFSNVHEPRHGGQIARGEFSISTVGGAPDDRYGASHEVSAYRVSIHMAL